MGPPSRWETTLYDKSAESSGRAGSGRLRFETRVRRPVLTEGFAERHKVRLDRLEQLADDSVDRLGRAMFDHVGLGMQCPSGMTWPP